MSEQDPEKLLDDVIAYLKQQREMFGDFPMHTDSVSEDDNTEQENKTSADSQQEQGKNVVPAGDRETTDDAEHSKDIPPQEQPDQAGEDVPSNAEGTTTSGSSNGEPKPESPAASSAKQSLFATNPDASDNIYDQVEACSSLKELYELCNKTEVLKTDLEGTNLVFGVGNADADLVLIGEAPGSEEDKQGEPFVGRAGQLLNKILQAIDLEREDVYIANILKHRPPNNRNPLPEEVKRSLPFLLKQLDLIDPKLILCLGKVAANTLLEKKDSLKNMRGTFYSFMNRYEMMVTYHPAALLRNERFKRPTWEDMKKLKKRYDELVQSSA